MESSAEHIKSTVSSRTKATAAANTKEREREAHRGTTGSLQIRVLCFQRQADIHTKVHHTPVREKQFRTRGLPSSETQEG